MTVGVTRTRIRLFDIGNNRGPGAEVSIVYDAKNIGSEVLANDEGSAYWTLPINHPELSKFVPLKRHYKIERLNQDTGSYDLVGAGLLTGADASKDEVVFAGSDYMGLMNTHYTKVLGAATGATSPLVYGSGGSASYTETGSFTLDMATAGVGRSFTTIANSSDLSTFSSDWNSHNEEQHIALGVISSTQALTIRGGVRFDLTTNANWSSSTTITKAVLKLYGSTYGHVAKTSSTSRNLNVRRLTTQDWTVNTLTGTEGFYNNATEAACDWSSINSNTTATGAASLAFTGITNNALYEIDITTIAQAWKSGEANYGVRLVNSAEQTLGRGLEFYGSKYATVSKRPKLYIEYETVVSTSADVDPTGLFRYKEESKKWLEITRITGREPAISKNANGIALSERTPVGLYILDKTSTAMTSGNYWPGQTFYPTSTTFDNTVGPTIANRFICRYDEENEKYIISGVVRIERAKQQGTAGADNDFYDYLTDSTILSDYSIKDVAITIIASPGSEVCSFYVWRSATSGYGTLSTNPYRSVEIPFWVELYKTGYTSASVPDLSPPSAPTSDSSIDHTASSVVVGGMTRYSIPGSAQYTLPILTDGQTYEFSAIATALINDGEDHNIKSGSASPFNQDKSPLSLRSETLEGIFSRHLTTANEGAFDMPALADGTEVGRMNWATIENVTSWPTNKLRYFTTGENITDFLRNMGDKQMAENDKVPAGTQELSIDLPKRTVFNFVGIRRSNGSAADGSKLFVNPAMGDVATLTLEYPGVIGDFRYNTDGRQIKNQVRIISSTPFLSGTYTAMTGVRLQGSNAKDEASQREFGLAPSLTAQTGFIDTNDADKGAIRYLEQHSDFDVAGTLQITLERDRLNPFKDFFLGDAVRVYIRRDNINVNNSSSSNILAGIYIVSGVTFKSPADGAEEIVIQLLNGRYFAAMKQG
tara:strand:+ start:9813 stop:12620 length:2808 start_codon:yes stop_codon:yes gene_type:complete